MSRFANLTATDVVILRNGDQVKVRQTLTAEESAVLKKNLIHFEYATEEGGNSQVVVKGGEWYFQRIEICRAYIVGWDFKDDSGAPVTYSSELVGSLTEDTVDEISEAIDGLQQARREEFAKKGIAPSVK